MMVNNNMYLIMPKTTLEIVTKRQEILARSFRHYTFANAFVSAKNFSSYDECSTSTVRPVKCALDASSAYCFFSILQRTVSHALRVVTGI